MIATHGVIGMGVRNNRRFNRQNRIEVKIAVFTVQAIFVETKKVVFYLGLNYHQAPAYLNCIFSICNLETQSTNRLKT